MLSPRTRAALALLLVATTLLPVATAADPVVLLHKPTGALFAGRATNLTVTFMNGPGAVSVIHFSADARIDGKVVATIDGNAPPLAANQTGEFTVAFTPPVSGDYVVTGAVLYDGRITPSATVNFPVAAPTALAGPGLVSRIIHSSTALIIAAASLLIVSGIVGFIALQKRKAKTAPPTTSPPPTPLLAAPDKSAPAPPSPAARQKPNHPANPVDADTAKRLARSLQALRDAMAVEVHAKGDPRPKAPPPPEELALDAKLDELVARMRRGQQRPRR